MKKRTLSTIIAVLAAVMLSFCCQKVYAAGTLTSIAVKDLPAKTEYYVGDRLSTSGLILRASYSDGTTKDVTSGFTCSPSAFAEDGKKTVTVSYSGKTATYTVNVKIMPSVVSQPVSVTTDCSKKATFTFAVHGKDVAYQWYFRKKGATEWTLWKGHTTSATSAVPNPTWNHMQLYCTASDAYGNQFKSVTVTVTLTDVLEITRQPVSFLNVPCNGTASVSISATGKMPQYQWYFRKTGETSFSRWKGTRKPSISFPVDPTWDGANIRCVVTDDSGKSETSKQTTVKLIYNVDTNQYLAIDTQPKSVSVYSGDSAAFSVTLKDSNRYGYYSSTPASYQWYYKKKSAVTWSEWKGHTSSYCKATSNDSWDGMQVRCLVSVPAYGKSVYSDIAVVTVDGKFGLVDPPADISVKSYETAVFRVRASGTGLTYQWYYRKKGVSSWSEWKGHTIDRVEARANLTWDGMQVRCTVRNSSGKSATSKAATVTVTPTPITILSQPENVRTVTGKNVSFRLSAVGDSLNYQWYYKKEGATAWTLWKGHTASVTSGTANSSWNGMQVRCALTDYKGARKYSSAATITVVEQPIEITSQPKNISIKANRLTTLSVKAVGDDLLYQWYYRKKGVQNWSLWKDYASATINPPANNSWDGMQVRCRITDAEFNSVYSAAATITIIPCADNEFHILSQPKSYMVGRNSYSSRALEFQVDANGEGMTYQWYLCKAGGHSFTKWAGHTKSSESAVPNETWDGIQFYCVITNGDGEKLYSDIARVTFVDNTITVTRQPENVTTKAGKPVTFSVNADGTGLTYQWYYKKKSASNFSIWKEYKSATINPPANSTWDGMQVYCQIKDAYGNIVNSTTTSVTLIPYEPGEFQITKQPQHHYFTKYDIRYDEDGYIYYVNANYSVAANGTDMTYQWYYCTSGQSNWIKLKNGASSSISLSMRDYSNVTAVYCVVTNGDGEQLYSDLGTLTIDNRW